MENGKLSSVFGGKAAVTINEDDDFGTNKNKANQYETISVSKNNNRKSDYAFPLVDGKPRKPNQHVILNVGGQVHETYLATLLRLPRTRLGQLARDYEQDEAYDPETKAFFFNRDPAIFVSVLQYYRTGELHIDHNICGNAIKNELEFWQLDASDIEPCCWSHYATFLENKETLKMLDDTFQDDALFAEPADYEPRWRRLQRRIWRHIEDPSYSITGKLFVSASIFFVVLSILAYILETHSFFRVPRSTASNNNDTSTATILLDSNITNGSSAENMTALYYNNVSMSNNNISSSSPPDDSSDHGDDFSDNNSEVVWWLSSITLTCFAWFAFEYILRLSVCPDKKDYFKSVLNNLDLLVLLVMCLESLAIVMGDIIPRNRYIRVMALARIVRLMKLMKHYRAFKVLVYTIKVSLNELVLMIIFLVIGVVIFACLIYYAEPETFPNIPIGCWWALITMTTVGYGDYVPTQLGGYVIGAVAAIFGVLTIAFTVPIVVNNFTLYYSHAQSRAKRKPKLKESISNNCKGDSTK